jgi:cob(I)alamin adenosyltransferase
MEFGLTRSICRRSERSLCTFGIKINNENIMKYINRLSDLFLHILEI